VQPFPQRVPSNGCEPVALLFGLQHEAVEDEREIAQYGEAAPGLAELLAGEASQ